MADAAMIINDLVLRTGRFGSPTLKVLPYGGIVGATHHNTATAIYPIGTVLQLFNSGTGLPTGTTTVGSEGWTEFVYGRFDKGAQNAAKGVLAMPKVVTEIFDFTPDEDDCGGAAAGFLSVVTISVMTDDYYGWFWSGGVCPADLCSFAATVSIVTNDSVTAGGSVTVTSAAGMTAAIIGLKATTGAQEAIGMSMIAD